MIETDLTTAQAKKIHDVLWPYVNYLVRLKKRMEGCGFHHDEPLYMDVEAAYERGCRLMNRLHYLTCKDGVGHPPGE